MSRYLIAPQAKEIIARVQEEAGHASMEGAAAKILPDLQRDYSESFASWQEIGNADKIPEILREDTNLVSQKVFLPNNRGLFRAVVLDDQQTIWVAPTLDSYARGTLAYHYPSIFLNRQSYRSLLNGQELHHGETWIRGEQWLVAVELAEIPIPLSGASELEAEYTYRSIDYLESMTLRAKDDEDYNPQVILATQQETQYLQRNPNCLPIWAALLKQGLDDWIVMG